MANRWIRKHVKLLRSLVYIKEWLYYCVLSPEPEIGKRGSGFVVRVQSGSGTLWKAVNSNRSSNHLSARW